jgi:hypothetical protein
MAFMSAHILLRVADIQGNSSIDDMNIVFADGDMKRHGGLGMTLKGISVSA